MTDSELRQLIESNARAIQATNATVKDIAQEVLHLSEQNRQLAEESQRAQAERAELRAKVDLLSDNVNALVRVVTSHQDSLEGIWEEIRRLRTESQRILAHLFGEDDQDAEQ